MSSTLLKAFPKVKFAAPQGAMKFFFRGPMKKRPTVKILD
jgi:hypothetical protein